MEGLASQTNSRLGLSRTNSIKSLLRGESGLQYLIVLRVLFVTSSFRNVSLASLLSNVLPFEHSGQWPHPPGCSQLFTVVQAKRESLVAKVMCMTLPVERGNVYLGYYVMVYLAHTI